MLADTGAILAEQQAVISLLMKRLQAATYTSVADAETLARALFGHLSVIERLVLPVFATSKTLLGAQAALRMVAAQLAAAVTEQQSSGSMTSYAELLASVPLVFLAEGQLLREATRDELRALSSVAEQVEEEFTLLIGRADVSEIRQSLSDDGTAS